MSDFDYDEFEDEDDDLFDDDDFFGDEDELFDEAEDTMERIELFDAEVDQQMRVLLTRRADPEERRKAAYWLGNSGAPKAITALRKVYRGESDDKIRQAAEYALGQFKALDQAIQRDEGETVAEALQRPENADIVERLTAITLQGGSAATPGSSLRRLAIVLTVTLVLLVIANVVASTMGGDGDGGEPERVVVAPDPEDQPTVDALEDILTRIGEASSDAGSLQEQFNSAATGGQLACDVTFNRPDAYTLPADVEAVAPPTVGLQVDRLNRAIEQLNTPLDIHDRACQEARAPADDEIDEAQNALNGILSELEVLEGAIITIENSIIATPAPNVTEGPTEEPTLTPTATIEPERVNSHIRAMSRIIDDLTAARGSLTLLNQYWQDAAEGISAGCDATTPAIPEDYTEPIPEDVTEIFPQLETARASLNLGLTQIRQGWQVFTTACANATLSAQASLGTTIAQNASDAVDEASAALSELRNR